MNNNGHAFPKSTDTHSQCVHCGLGLGYWDSTPCTHEHGHEHGHDYIYCVHCGLESCYWDSTPCTEYTDRQAAIDSAYMDEVERRAWDEYILLYERNSREWANYYRCTPLV